jgi:hypothetical protein
MLKYIFILIISAVLTFFCSDFVAEKQFSFYKDILSALLNISAIIFAIIGAWIAIIYPKSMSTSLSNQDYNKSRFDKASEDTDYLSDLVEIVLVSSIVLLCVLSAKFLSLIIDTSLPIAYIEYVRYSGFLVLSFLTFSQISVIFKVIWVHYRFLAKLRKKQAKEEADSLARPHRDHTQD